MAENLRGPALAEAQKLLTPYLDPGEKLIWAARRSFALSLRAFALRTFLRFIVLLFLFFSFGVVILPSFLIENVDRTVFSFLLFNIVWLFVFVFEGICLFRNHLRHLYALSTQRAFFAATKPHFEVDAVCLRYLDDEKIQTYGAAGSVVFPHVRRWGVAQFAFQRNPSLGFFAIPEIATATAALQLAQRQSAVRSTIGTASVQAPRPLRIYHNAALFFRPLPLSFLKEILDRDLKIEWTGRPQIKSIVLTTSFLIRLSASLFFTGFVFLSFLRQAPVSSSFDFSALFFVLLIWLYCLAPIFTGAMQTYVITPHHLYIISGWIRLTLRTIGLADVTTLQFLHRSGNRGSILFGVLHQQLSSHEGLVLMLNKIGFFHLTKMRETQSLLQELLRKARRDGVPTPSTPSTDTESPALRGG